MVLEGQRDSSIEILDSPVLIPILPLVEYWLVLIEELNPEEEGGVDLDEIFQPLLGKEYVDGETILDILWRRNLRGDEVPEYEEAPAYNNPGYISNH